MFDTTVRLHNSFSTACSFVYAALYGALPSSLQEQFLWNDSYVKDSKLIVRLTGSAITKRDRKWDLSRTIVCELDNGALLDVFLKQKVNDDGNKEKWRVVSVSYVYIGFDFNSKYTVNVESPD